MSFTHRVAYHEMMARLGVGDLHPGGKAASSFLLAELRKHGVSRVLEVGAGIGNTTERLLKSGFAVTAIEPNATLRKILTKRLRIEAGSTPFETFEASDGSYDAVISESVFYALDVPTSLAKAQRLLRPGGLFGFAEMFWTEAAEPNVIALNHDQTKKIFGIPMAPREPVTSATWGKALCHAGFSELAAMRLDPAAPAGGRHMHRKRLALGLLRRPYLIPTFLSYRSHERRGWAPPRWLESRVAVWKRT